MIDWSKKNAVEYTFCLQYGDNTLKKGIIRFEIT